VLGVSSVAGPARFIDFDSEMHSLGVKWFGAINISNGKQRNVIS